MFFKDNKSSLTQAVTWWKSEYVELVIFFPAEFFILDFVPHKIYSEPEQIPSVKIAVNKGTQVSVVLKIIDMNVDFFPFAVKKRLSFLKLYLIPGWN